MKELTRLLAPDRGPQDWLRRHSIYWLLLIPSTGISWVYWSQSLPQALLCALASSLFRYLPATYLFLYGVLPAFMRGHYRQTAVRLLGWLLIAFVLQWLFQTMLPLRLLLFCVGNSLTDAVVSPQSLRQLFGPGFMVTNSLVIVAAFLKLFRYQYQREQANQQLIHETLTLELHLLTAQLQPHFLFNTLNTIYSLTLHQTTQAGKAVAKLSALLNYMFQEDSVPQVPLRQEINLLRNYVDLEHLRYGDRLTLTWDVAGNLEQYLIPPLLLLPLVENAFKHGAAEQTGPAAIDLLLLVAPDQLLFRIRNTKGYPLPRTADKPGGLGLKNVQRRLHLLYPTTHQLRVQDDSTWFEVEIKLQLASQPDGRWVDPVTGAGNLVRETTTHSLLV